MGRYRGKAVERFFRRDAAFANPEIYELLEAEHFGYVIRPKGNSLLHNKIKHLTTRPVGRPSAKPTVCYESFRYQTYIWMKPRRVVVKIEWHQGNCFLESRFIVTNLTWQAKRVVGFYNQRGTAKQRIKEGKLALTWTRLSCHASRDNAVRLQPFALAYNLGNFLRRLALPRKIRQWTLTTLHEKSIKIEAKVHRHAGSLLFQFAEGSIPRELFETILQKIARLRLLPAARPV